MKIPATTLVVLAASGQALGSWFKDVTVTETATRLVQSCPCDGEVKVTPIARGQDFGPPGHGAGPVTRAGPIVAVYTTAGTVTTKTGIVVELGPTPGGRKPGVTTTIWTGPLPTEGMSWVNWDSDNENNAAPVQTRFTTINGRAPTNTAPELWTDWLNPQPTGGPSGNTRTSSSSRSSSRTGGPIGGSTSTTTSRFSTTSSSSSVVGGTFTSTSTTSASSSSGIGPIGGSTTTSSSTTSTLSTSSTMTSETSSSSTSSASSSLGPIGGTTSSSSSSESVTSSTSTTLSTTTSTSSTSSTITSSSSTTSSSTTSLTTTSSTTSVAPGATVTVDVRSLSYIDGILLAHNVHRRNHSAEDLTWSDTQATIAAEIAASCVFAHNTAAGGGGYGQNIGAGYTPAQVPAMIGNDMYNGEMPFYPLPYGVDNADTTNFSKWGHFSQIVWKGTQQVGCATQFCPNGVTNAEFTQYFTVCNYVPPGNYQGSFSNVGAPLGQPITVIQTN
ncbi:hypothetical protein AYO20_03057 [Fonsecaea nubica]|uniref:SCP domain-containing protein n=1 Tax=Fonsecaea nubica TaxID=856822 RepID=A0A178D5N9_9EURO|nr:hypothetical protein AYO20_03057 [Fonsecaea nubica]OAL37550.1 hypothetical protein AYO20_03057 [Fonsecaea nubica]